MLPGVYPPGAYSTAAGYSKPQGVNLPAVKLRGLPFRCEEADVLDFFSGLDVVEVLLVRRDGRMAGEALVLLASQVQAELALRRNKMYMGKRYVEVFKAKRAEWYGAIANEVAEEGGAYRDEPRAALGGGRDGGATVPFAGAGYSSLAGVAGEYLVVVPRGASSLASHVQSQTRSSQPAARQLTGVVRLRGLPFSATSYDIMDFFSGYSLSEDSIHIVANASGRSSGQAFVEFASAEDAQRAMLLDRSLMGTRYIELYPSSREEVTAIVAKNST